MFLLSVISRVLVFTFLFFCFLMIRRPPRSTLFPTRRSSDLQSQRARCRDRGCLRRKAPAHRGRDEGRPGDRKSTRLNSSHLGISYAVFCLKKKKQKKK